MVKKLVKRRDKNMICENIDCEIRTKGGKVIKLLFILSIIICFKGNMYCQNIKSVKEIDNHIRFNFINGKYELILKSRIEKCIDSNLIFNLFDLSNKCIDCQFFIYEGDTVNYYDEKGYMQGDFIDFCFPKRIGRDEECRGLNSLRCSSCDIIEERTRFRNDSIISVITFGYKNKKKTDTLSYRQYNYDKKIIYNKGIFDKENYLQIVNTDLQGKKQGIGYKYDLKTKKLIEKANYKDNYYSDSIFYYFDDGKLMAEALYENEKNKIFHRFYRTNGLRYAEVMIIGDKITSKECFDDKGKKVIPCDSTKTLNGLPKKDH